MSTKPWAERPISPICFPKSPWTGVPVSEGDYMMFLNESNDPADFMELGRVLGLLHGARRDRYVQLAAEITGPRLLGRESSITRPV